MAGSREGGLKAAATIKKKYGDKFFVDIGVKGGQAGVSENKGFANQKLDKNGMTGSQRAKSAGSKGGKISKRVRAKKPIELEEDHESCDDHPCEMCRDRKAWEGFDDYKRKKYGAGK